MSFIFASLSQWIYLILISFTLLVTPTSPSLFCSMLRSLKLLPYESPICWQGLCWLWAFCPSDLLQAAAFSNRQLTVDETPFRRFPQSSTRWKVPLSVMFWQQALSTINNKQEKTYITQTPWVIFSCCDFQLVPSGVIIVSHSHDLFLHRVPFRTKPIYFYLAPAVAKEWIKTVPSAWNAAACMYHNKTSAVSDSHWC